MENKSAINNAIISKIMIQDLRVAMQVGLNKRSHCSRINGFLLQIELDQRFVLVVRWRSSSLLFNPASPAKPSGPNKPQRPPSSSSSSASSVVVVVVLSPV